MRTVIGYFWSLLAFFATGGGAVYVLYDLWCGTWTWRSVSLFTGTFVLIATGITVGYHRYVTHRTFEFTWIGEWLAKPFLLWAGCLGWQNSPLWWGTVHSDHHAHADQEGDPHSPVLLRGGFWRRCWQVLWAHMFWIPHTRPDIRQFCQRTRRPLALERFLDRWYLLVGPLSGIALAAAIAGMPGIAWYLAAVFVTWNLTSSVNSLTHLGDLWGYGQLRTSDHSTNLLLLALLTFGESLHRNHHAFPRSARFGHRWWEKVVDIGYLEILLLKWCGLVRHVHVPTVGQLHTKLLPEPSA
jgi:stearoyl-CoA desaturase (delta-9 desaturase)